MRLTLFTLLLVAASASNPATTDHSLSKELVTAATLDHVTLTVTMPQTASLSLDDLARVNISLRNDSKHSLQYDDRVESFDIQLHDARGELVHLTTKGIEKLQIWGPFNGVATRELKAGSAIEREYDLRELFQLKQSGEYTLTVMRVFEWPSMRYWGKMKIRQDIIVGAVPNGVPDD